jgi:hypothetical protein
MTRFVQLRCASASCTRVSGPVTRFFQERRQERGAGVSEFVAAGLPCKSRSGSATASDGTDSRTSRGRARQCRPSREQLSTPTEALRSEVLARFGSYRSPTAALIRAAPS